MSANLCDSCMQLVGKNWSRSRWFATENAACSCCGAHGSTCIVSLALAESARQAARCSKPHAQSKGKTT